MDIRRLFILNRQTLYRSAHWLFSLHLVFAWTLKFRHQIISTLPSLCSTQLVRKKLILGYILIPGTNSKVLPGWQTSMQFRAQVLYTACSWLRRHTLTMSRTRSNSNHQWFSTPGLGQTSNGMFNTNGRKRWAETLLCTIILKHLRHQRQPTRRHMLRMSSSGLQSLSLLIKWHLAQR